MKNDKFFAGGGIGAQYPMYPTSTNTPAGCTGNRQSRSIGEGGDTGSDVTPRVPLYMDIIFSFVRFVISNTRTCQEGMQISPPHAIYFRCNGGRRYGRRRVCGKHTGVIKTRRVRRKRLFIRKRGETSQRVRTIYTISIWNNDSICF